MKPQEQEETSLDQIRAWFLADFSGLFIPKSNTPTHRDYIKRVDELIERAKAEGVRLGRIEEASRCVEWAGKKIRTLDLNMEEIKHETN